MSKIRKNCGIYLKKSYGSSLNQLGTRCPGDAKILSSVQNEPKLIDECVFEIIFNDDLHFLYSIPIHVYIYNMVQSISTIMATFQLLPLMATIDMAI